MLACMRKMIQTTGSPRSLFLEVPLHPLEATTTLKCKLLAQDPWQLIQRSQSEDYNCRCEPWMTGEFFKTPVLFSNKYCLLHKNLQRKINEAMRLPPTP